VLLTFVATTAWAVISREAAEVVFVRKLISSANTVMRGAGSIAGTRDCPLSTCVFSCTEPSFLLWLWAVAVDRHRAVAKKKVVDRIICILQNVRCAADFREILDGRVSMIRK